MSTSRQTGSEALVQQQGQFDWFSLAKSRITWGVEIISRLSAAGVDPYTVIVGQNMCKLFKLDPVGRKNMAEALVGLQAFRSVGDTVWFGIGARHLVRDLAVTDEGKLCAGICGALSSCYSETVAAEILAELVSISKAPVELTPSIFEWNSLVHACNGILHATSFPVHAEKLMNLFPNARQFSSSDRSGPDCSTPASLAMALLAIGDVSRKAVVGITITGGADAGWFAAVSEWFFGLHVQILDQNGNECYRTGLNEYIKVGTSIQILIRFSSTSDSTGLHGPQGSMEIQCLEKVFNLQEASQLFRGVGGPPSFGDNPTARVSGRVAWETAFSQTFRPEFSSLVGMRDVMALGLGSAARVLTAIAHNESNIYGPIWQDPESRERWSLHGDSTHGKGFVSNTVYWFPELGPLEDKMQLGARMTYLDAKSHYETQISLIQNSCQCSFCQNGYRAESKGTDYCKVVIFETILRISQILSVVSADRRLCLKRHGIESLYERVLYTRLSPQAAGGTMQEIHGVLQYGIAQYSVGQLHTVALELFAGEAPDKPFSQLGTPAFSKSGICAYLDILREVSDSKDHAGRIHIIPGRIEYCGRPYDCLQDGQPLSVNMHNAYTRSTDTDPQRLQQKERQIRNIFSYQEPIICVKQLVNGLQI